MAPVNKIRRCPHVPIGHREAFGSRGEVATSIHIRYVVKDMDMGVCYGMVGHDGIGCRRVAIQASQDPKNACHVVYAVEPVVMLVADGIEGMKSVKGHKFHDTITTGKEHDLVVWLL